MSNAAKKIDYAVNKNEFCLVGTLLAPNEQALNDLLRFLIEDAEGQCSDLALDVEGFSQFSVETTRCLLLLRQAISRSQKQIRLLHASGPLAEWIEQQGLKDAFKTVNSVDEAIRAFTPSKPLALDTSLFQPFLVSTMKVLETQASVKPQAHKPYRRGPNEKLLGDISGVIGLVTDSFNGAVVLSFPKATFLAIMSKMLGEEFTELTNDLQDGAAELTNIIFGQAKVTLNNNGFKIQTALPSVIVGADHSVVLPNQGPRLVIPFSSDAGPFAVEICLSA